VTGYSLSILNGGEIPRKGRGEKKVPFVSKIPDEGCFGKLTHLPKAMNG
jgi:hypothetical protein